MDVSTVEGLLFQVHMMLAIVAKTPELQLEQSEAHNLAESVAAVSRHYEIEASAKAIDWSRLLMVAGMIYGPRIAAIGIKRRRPKQPTQDHGPFGNVTAFPG